MNTPAPMRPEDVSDEVLAAALSGYYGHPTTIDEADRDLVNGLRAALAAGGHHALGGLPRGLSGGQYGSRSVRSSCGRSRRQRMAATMNPSTVWSPRSAWSRAYSAGSGRNVLAGLRCWLLAMPTSSHKRIATSKPQCYLKCIATYEQGAEMTATKSQTITQADAIAIAARHEYRVETYQQTTGDHWDVRIYSTADGYRKTGYDRRRDVGGSDIPAAILTMVATAVHELPWGTRLTVAEALDLLADEARGEG